MALNGSMLSRYQRDQALEKYIDKLIAAKSIDTHEGSVVVIRDLEKKAPKTIDPAGLKYGDIKPVKGPDACLLPDVRYKVIIYDQTWQMMKPANQKLALLYLLNQVKTDDKTGEPALWKHDVKGFRSFIRKYGFDWMFEDNVKDPLLVETTQAEDETEVETANA